MSKVFRATHKRIRENQSRNSKHGEIDMSVFHHESTPRDPYSSRRSVRPPSTADMLKVIHGSPRPKKCSILCYCVFVLFAISLSIPELAELRWWENITSISQALSWGPFGVVVTSVSLTVIAVFCTSRCLMFVSAIISFLSLPLIVAQLAVCSTPAVLTLCCCFPSQCLLSLTHASDRLSDHFALNQTCRYMVPVSRTNYHCATTRAYFILFWISTALTLILTSFLVTAQWYWIRSPSWKFVKERNGEVPDINVKDSARRNKVLRKRQYHRQEDMEELDEREEGDYFTSEEEEEEEEEEEYRQRKDKYRQRRIQRETHKRRRKKKNKSKSKSKSKKENRHHGRHEYYSSSSSSSSSSEKEEIRKEKHHSSSNNSGASAADKEKARAAMNMLTARSLEERSVGGSNQRSSVNSSGSSTSSSGSEEIDRDINMGPPAAPSTKYARHSGNGGVVPPTKNNSGGGGSLQFFSPRESVQRSEVVRR